MALAVSTILRDCSSTLLAYGLVACTPSKKFLIGAATFTYPSSKLIEGYPWTLMVSHDLPDSAKACKSLQKNNVDFYCHDGGRDNTSHPGPHARA